MSARRLRRRTAHGFALMMAIFIIVTLAAIGVYLLTVSTGQLEAATQDEQGTRAYQAARTGMDWAAYQVLRQSNCPNQTLQLQQGLAGFFSKVECALVATEMEGGDTVNAYQIKVTGCNNNTCPLASPGPTYVERQLQLTLTRTP